MGTRYKGYNPSQNAAQKRYMEGKVAIRTIVSQDERDDIQAHAAARGESLNVFLRRAIAETMERDKESAGD